MDLAGTFGPDRHKIRRSLRGNREDAQRLIRDSKALVERRADLRPAVSYPDELPFSARIDDIKQAIESSQVVVICGETGSGKSTQLPKLCIDIGRGIEGLIGHTQPRRLAARSVADRVASELGVRLGDQVGSKVRFGDNTSSKTLVKLMTDGILLAESRSDRLLEQYDTIIVDEAHERSLNIDFLLGILTGVLPRRPDLKLIVTSATIDPHRFVDHFSRLAGIEVPIIEVSGRTYPVETIYREPVSEDGRTLDLPEAIADAAEHLAIKDGFNAPGDVLVFLPGEREIREAAKALRDKTQQSRLLSGTEIVPLYARLSFADQQRVFRRAPHRRIVLSTNVAETSLTVPGIRYVIDSGLARINRYSPRRRVQSLQIEAISQASARQRAGRCGRTEPGTCVRLYSESDHDGRDSFTAPEIQRTNLAGVILQMRALRLGDPRDFPFIEPPDSRRINEAYDTLFELGAVDARQELTRLGERLAKLPIDPRIGRILLAAETEGVLSDALIVASALEVQDPRERPTEVRDAADAKHQRFADNGSDFVTLLNLWDHYHAEKDKLSRSQLRKACQSQFINYIRMNEWTDTHRQLRDICREIGLRLTKRPKEVDRDGLHRAVLAGCLTTIGRKHDEGGFASPQAGIFHIHPGSAVKAKGTGWLVTAELVRTTRLFARMSARIEGAWVEELAGHLITREYSDARYNPDRGVVEASAKITFGQLEIARGKRIDYGSVDREDARRVFIEEALVAGELAIGAPFEEHNERLLREIYDQEARLRRGQTPTDEALAAFFAARIPPDISSARSFDKWLRRAEREDERVLFMTPEMIGCPPLGAASEESIPSVVSVGTDGAAELTYRFEPGGVSDGIEARLSVADAARADPAMFEWLVPGWMAAKVEAIIKGLPRSVRRQIDVAQLARDVAGSMQYREGDFYARVAEIASARSGLGITPAMCRDVPLPDHLRMIATVVDPLDGEVASGRDLHEVIAAARNAEVASRKDSRRVPVIRGWPEEAPSVQPPLALVDAGDGVRLMELPDQTGAQTEHWFGCRRLIGLKLSREVQRVLRHTPHADRLAVLYQTIEGAPPLLGEVSSLLAEIGRGDNPDPPISRERFEKLVDRVDSELGDRLTRVVDVMARALVARQAVLTRLESQAAADASLSVRDVEFQLRQLVHAGTFRRARWSQLARLPAYVSGMSHRLERLRGDGIRRDREAMARVSPHWGRCIQRAGELARIGRVSPSLEAYRWMIEEYRLTLFAPQLAVRGAASEKSLGRVWASVEAGQ